MFLYKDLGAEQDMVQWFIYGEYEATCSLFSTIAWVQEPPGLVGWSNLTLSTTSAGTVWGYRYRIF
jgi:hypothetical protein